MKTKRGRKTVEGIKFKKKVKNKTKGQMDF